MLHNRGLHAFHLGKRGQQEWKSVHHTIQNIERHRIIKPEVFEENGLRYVRSRKGIDEVTVQSNLYKSSYKMLSLIRSFLF